MVTAASDLIDRPVLVEALTLHRCGKLQGRPRHLVPLAPGGSAADTPHRLKGSGVVAARAVIELPATSSNLLRRLATSPALVRSPRVSARISGALRPFLAGMLATITGWLIAAD